MKRSITNLKLKKNRKTAVNPPTLYRVSQVKKTQSGIIIVSESLKREQIYISYERQ